MSNEHEQLVEVEALIEFRRAGEQVPPGARLSVGAAEAAHMVMTGHAVMTNVRPLFGLEAHSPKS